MSQASDIIDYLISTGAVTSPLAVADAAAGQVNTADTATTGTTSEDINNAWGKAIPELMGNTRTVCLPLWAGNPVAQVSSSGDEIDYIDFAVLVGRRGSRSSGVIVKKIFFDNNKVYDADDPSVTTLLHQSLQFVFYDGTQKAPDPTMVAANASVTPFVPTPAFTNRMYIVFAGLQTRVIDASTTVTQFSKLPEVQVELQESETQARGGGTFRAYSNAPEGATYHGSDFGYFSDNNLLCLFVDGTDNVDVYNPYTKKYQGRTVLQAPWNVRDDKGRIVYRGATPHVMSDAGYLIAWSDDLGNGKPLTYVWNLFSGVLVYLDTPRDSLGNVQQCNRLTDAGDGWLLPSYSIFDGTGLALFDSVSQSMTLFQVAMIGGEPAGPSDYQTQFGSIPFDGERIIYYANGPKLYRVVVTDGFKETIRNVGKVTHDGSGEPVTAGTYASVVLDLSLENIGLRIEAVMCDTSDARYVYIITVAADTGETRIRRIANFWYYNPQAGGAVPGGISYNSALSDFDVHIEIASAVLPKWSTIYTSPSATRDRRYPLFAYGTGLSATDLVVVNFRNLSSSTYKGGALFAEDGSEITPGPFSYQGPAFLLPQTNEVISWNAYGVPAAGTVQPKTVTDGAARLTLEDVFLNNALLGGYASADVSISGLDSEVSGQQLNQTVQFKDLMAQYCAVFRVDMTETAEGGLKFSRRLDVTQPDGFIVPGDLVPTDTSDPSQVVSIDRVASNEVPSQLQLGFVDEDFGYQTGSQLARRTVYPHRTANSEASLALSVPVVMNGSDALYFAGLALFDMWAGKTTFVVTVPAKYIYIEPGDVVQLTRPSGRNDLCKVTQVVPLPSRELQLTLSSEARIKPTPYLQNANVPTQAVPKPGAAGVSYGTMLLPSPRGVYVSVIDNIDLSLLIGAGNKAPVYVAASSPVDFYTQTTGNDPAKQLTTSSLQQFGALVGSMPYAPGPLATDSVGSFEIRMQPGQAAPTSCSDADFIAGKNNVVVGAPGRWELVYFRDVVGNTDGTVTLSHLLRGRANSDVFVGTDKPGDVAVFNVLQAAEVTSPVAPGSAVTVYGMPPGATAQPRGGIYDTVALSGAALAPLPPQDVRASRQGNGDVLVTWHRRDRQPAPDFWGDPPLSDAPERYTLTLATAAGSRVVNVTSPNWTYTAAMQATDKFTGNSLHVSLYQSGNAIAKGFPYEGSVNVK